MYFSCEIILCACFGDAAMNIRTLHGEEDKKQEDEQQQARNYAGGEKSGLAVEMPRGDYGESSSGDPPPPGSSKVTIFKNGFQLNDGEFRSIEDPKNKEFLDNVKAGFAPSELREAHKGAGPVHLVLDDRRTEDYVPPPPPPYVLFSGTGNRLATASSSPPISVDSSRGGVVVDSAQPLTSIQFRFPGGARATQTFNHVHTVADLHSFILQAAQPTSGYSVLEGFPPKEIPNDSRMTLRDAGLLSAALTVKFV